MACIYGMIEILFVRTSGEVLKEQIVPALGSSPSRDIILIAACQGTFCFLDFTYLRDQHTCYCPIDQPAATICICVAHVHTHAVGAQRFTYTYIIYKCMYVFMQIDASTSILHAYIYICIAHV